ncbi:MAG: DUF3443 family protein [Candidatus Contendobacter sp.]|nr:DUF3443 family protein [Candidatus Contendobacter sp.]
MFGFWISGNLFDGGALRAQEAQTIASYDQNVAAYRQTVLTAFQSVEDNLAALAALRGELQAERAAERAAAETLRITQNQTKSGSTTVTVDPTATAYNVLPIIIDGGPPGIAPNYVNGLFTSVRVCAPGSTTQCQTIDHVLVDTGSVGLRLLSAAGDGEFSLSLPQQKAPDGNTLAECLQFVDGSFISIHRVKTPAF